MAMCLFLKTNIEAFSVHFDSPDTLLPKVQWLSTRGTTVIWFPICSVQGNGETFDLIPTNLARRKETIKIVIKPSSKSRESLTLKIRGNVANLFIYIEINFNFCDMIQEDVCHF
jgi:hypothetical protein